MHSLRRAAVRALSCTSTAFAPSSRALSTSIRSTRPSAFAPLTSTRFSVLPITPRRTYATEEEEKPQSFIDSAKETVNETAQAAKAAVTSAVSSGIASVAPSTSRGGPLGRAADPSPNLYIGNLYFEVTEEVLKKEFSRFGEVVSSKIIYDGRGLSKGFGYIEFAGIPAATEARNSLDGQVLEGRRLSVQFAIKTGNRERRVPNAQGYTNAPSKTLFIGNMSYEMSDKDLNDLFRDIKNVLDVRVAIDRRTGQPRGFAHADFLDVQSAEAAAEYLKSKEFYGRNLRIDYSANNGTNTPAARERD